MLISKDFVKLAEIPTILKVHQFDFVSGALGHLTVGLKVNKNRNGSMKTLFLPKTNAIISRISALYNRAEILKMIALLF